MVLASRYAAKLRDKAENLKKDLLRFSEAIEEWVLMQKTWMYMEKIFLGSGSNDIKLLLPEEF